ncbi:hypothetical protein MKK07_000078 [Acinetobacter baumannii]|uniref:hypothetical protein n=1 Tax=Acinetobacter baumannii TaxID=470 RepID=UPI000A35A2F0|nr:hypothetical protein [Acinetobacter baumannii]EKU3613141.1 hypothetical protein [Acinetobacter baumannii]OTK50007.1 hypothetical protein B9X70_11910 [Acinetobacter baumannii]OTM36576.1 hypothetical protein B9X47_04500 [Acinetobacter baumannii]
MSVVTRSDVPSKNNLGTIKSLQYTAQKAYDEYAARVVADGGAVLDPAATLSLFSTLISLGVFGVARTFVSGKAGVKIENGIVTKVYALDGFDLTPYNMAQGGIGITVNSGELNFNNSAGVNSAAATGTILVTPKFKAKGRGLVLGIFGSSLTLPGSGQQYPAAFTKLFDENNSSPLWMDVLSRSSGYHSFTRQIGETPNQNSTVTTSRATANMQPTGSKYVWFADYLNKKIKGYRNGVRVTEPVVDPQFSNIDGFEGCINFGGLVYKTANVNTANLCNIKVSLFFVYDNLPESKVEALSVI